MKYLILVVIALGIYGCEEKKVEVAQDVEKSPIIELIVEPQLPPTEVIKEEESSPVVAPTPTPTPVAKVNPCELAPYSVKLGNKEWQKDIDLPATGKWVLESSLSTKEDLFPEGRLFPKDNFENIQAHLNRSCIELKKMGLGCNIHSNKYVKQWTPPEGGKAGQGATGNLKPSVVEEMMTCNMMFRSGSKPKPGTKFLMTREGVSTVINMGYEVGPRSKDWLGGCQGEVFEALGGSSNRTISIGYLKDQKVPYGPIKCNN